MKIFYLCPDFKPPSGGVKVLYRQVEILRAHQFEAYIMHFKKGFKPEWFTSTAPVVYMNDSPPIWPGDTVVVPEGFPDFLAQFQHSPINTVVIALNPHYIYEILDEGKTWRSYGVEWVITSSELLANFIRWSMGLERVFVVSTTVDRSLFTYVPGQQRRQIAYMTRKDTATPLVAKILQAKEPALARTVEFAPVGHLPMVAYAQVLQQSQIYLTTSPFEGTNLSVLEAMACGCIGVGYHGIGGQEYIVPDGPAQNFFLAESMNYIELARLLYDLLQKFNHNDPLLERVRQNGLATAARFSAARETSELLNFWRAFFDHHSIPLPNSDAQATKHSLAYQ